MADADEGDREGTLAWIREPAGANEIRVFLECGDDVEISDRARDALDHLLKELYDAEVSGYAIERPPAQRPQAFGQALNIFAVSFEIAGNKCGKKMSLA